MLDDNADTSATSDTTPEAALPGDEAPAAPRKRATRAKKTTTKSAAKKTAAAADAPAVEAPDGGAQPAASADTPEKPKKKAAAKRTAKKAAAPPADSEAGATAETTDQSGAPSADVSGDAPVAKKTTRKRTTKKTAAKKAADTSAEAAAETPAGASAEATAEAGQDAGQDSGRPSAAPLFQAPTATTTTRRTRKPAAKAAAAAEAEATQEPEAAPTEESGEGDDEGATAARRRRRRGGRRRRKSGGEGDAQGEQGESDDESTADEAAPAAEAAGEPSEGSASSRRRRRRRRSGEDDGDGGDDPANTVTRVRSGRTSSDEITAVSGSTRLEAKKQRRREGREAGRRRAPIVSEAEFLARRESVNRVMVIRHHDDITQIGVLEDNVLVEHYVARESQTSLIGNVYLGRVQNVLPSMEAAFIDIGKGRNAVLYAGEVNWSALGHKDGQPRKIESVLSSGQSILVQVTKDPIGHKGARLTSQISLAGRFLVYVPDGTTSGISRKLPDTERNRLKNLLKDIVPETAGVIVRTAAEGAAEDELTRDVERLKARWEDIEKKAGGGAPQLLYGEPDLTLKVVRDLFTEDFSKLVIQGDEAWDTVQGYVVHVAPDLESRLERYEPKKDQDVFAAYRIDEQIKKGLERKVWLPSGGSLVIDRTEAMTVIDVNTGKFTGSGGNLEETVTKNNLEAAEEIVRQLRLRDIGGIIVVDFIDMVLESNRDLVLRRMVECLGRDRTRHQVAEVTSLGLVQMTRKRIGTGLLESFSHDCPSCHGRGVVIEDAPVEPKKAEEEPRRARRSRGRGRAAETNGNQDPTPARSAAPSPKDIAAMARHHADDEPDETADIADASDLSDDLLVDVADEAGETSETESVADEAVGEASPEAVAEATEEPAEAATEEPAEEPAGIAVEPQEQPAPEPEDEAPAAQPAEPAEPARPTVATRTRRRAASRPAGPPASAGGLSPDASVDGGSSADGVEAPAVPDEGAPALHVPVKRKGGARKR